MKNKNTVVSFRSTQHFLAISLKKCMHQIETFNEDLEKKL